jgi:hypothetical protein
MGSRSVHSAFAVVAYVTATIAAVQAAVAKSDVQIYLHNDLYGNVAHACRL